MKPFHYNQDPLYAAAASILTGQQLTEEVVAFKNQGFKLVNGLMSDEDIHDAVNSSIKSAVQKLGDSTWDVVTDIYGKRANGEWAGDWIMARKGGGSWLTIKDGGPFKAHDSISSVLSFFEIEEEIEEAKGGEFASLLGKQVHHGSPGYPTAEVITSVTPHQTQSGKFEIEFESGTFDVLSIDDLDELMNGAEVHFKSPHGGMTVIELKEGDEDWEGKSWNPKERKELRAALESGKKLTYDEFRTLAHNYYKKSAKDHALNNLMTMSDQMTVDDVARMLDIKLKLKGDQVFATKLKEGHEDAIQTEIDTVAEKLGLTDEQLDKLYFNAKKAYSGSKALPTLLRFLNYIDNLKEPYGPGEKSQLIHYAKDGAIGMMDITIDMRKYEKGMNPAKSKSFVPMESEMDEDAYSQKMIKNQLQTIISNSNVCLQMVEDDCEFPKWAQSKIAVAEAGIVSVTEFMELHNSDDYIDEAQIGSQSDPFGMGTVTITSPGNPLHGKQANIFHKFDDGRINVQYQKSDKKGDVLNITLTKGQYKLDKAMSESYTVKTDAARAVMDKFTMLDAVELEDFLKAAQDYFAEEGESEQDFSGGGPSSFYDLAIAFGRAAKVWSNRRGN